MGSVNDDYKCPLCGAVGQGGYVLDGFAYFPVCTVRDGTSCMDKCLDGMWVDDVLAHAMIHVLRNHKLSANYDITLRIAQFLAPRGSFLHSDSCSDTEQ